jgi:cobalt/nickel transport system permease protein
MILIDKLCYTSKLRIVNTHLKFTLSMTTLCICVAARSITIGSIILVTMCLLTILKGGISFFRYLRLLLAPAIFLMLSSIAILFSISPTPLSPFSILIGSHYITISHQSILSVLHLTATAFGGISCLYFLALSTPVTDLLSTLKKLHCPDIFLELMLLMYRFIFLLLEIADNLNISRQSRLGNRNHKTALTSIGMLLSNLLIVSFKRSSYLYDSMESRCYQGQIHILEEEKQFKPSWLIWALIYDTALIMLAFIIKQ